MNKNLCVLDGRLRVLSALLSLGMGAAWPAHAAQPEAAGLRFVVVGSHDILDSVSPSTRDTWRRADLLVLPGEGAEWLEELGCKCAIIRPDRYVLAVAGTAAALDAASELIPLVRH